MQTHLRAAAVSLIEDQFKVSCTDVPDDSLKKLIEGMYLGGWRQFAIDYRVQPKSTALTIHQLRRKVYDLTGYEFTLGMFEEVVSITLAENQIGVLIRTAKVDERRRSYIIKSQGYRLVTLTYSEGWWDISTLEMEESSDQLTVARGDFTPSSPDQYEWERMCYRPGNSRFPMDNYQATDSDKMKKHWRQS